jgi:outer membrane protein TolC
MKIGSVVGILVLVMSSTASAQAGAGRVVGADTAGLSATLWQRARAVESAAVDLTPTPSPQAPDSLSLTECVALAFRHSSGFRQDQERLVNARRSLWVADQRLFYTLTGSGQRAKSPGGTPENSVSASAGTRLQALGGGSVKVGVDTGTQQTFGDLFSQQPELSVSYDQPLLRGMGLASSTAERIRGARTALASEELSFYDSHQDLAQRVTEAYFSVLLAEGEVEISQRSADRAKQLYDVNYAKFSGEGLKQPGEEWVGQVAEIDVDQARLSWEQSKQQLISSQQDYRDAMDRLLLAMGFLPGATPKLTTAIAYSPQEYDQAALVETALANSTDLGRLELSRQDTAAALRIARSQSRPDISASLGVTDPGDTLGGAPISNGWFTGVTADFPLLDRSLKEDVARAVRDLNVLQQQIVATRDTVKQAVQRQIRAAESSRARIDIGQQSVTLATKNRQAAQGMYDEGLIDYLRVLDADDRLVQAERSLLQEKVQYFTTTVGLQRTLGEDITQGLPE